MPPTPKPNSAPASVVQQGKATSIDEDMRTVKLHIPLSHLVRLQSFRVLRRTTMSQLLAEALGRFFETTGRPDLKSLSQMEPHAQHQP